MKVGVKYCGGCNPRYDRSKFIDRVKQELGNNHHLETAKEGNAYDFLLVIGGCTNCCANYDNIQIKQEALCVKSERDYEKIVHSLINHRVEEKG